MSMHLLILKLKKLNVKVNEINGELVVTGPERYLTPKLVSEITTNKSKLLSYLTHFNRLEENSKINQIEEQEHYAVTPQQKYWLTQVRGNHSGKYSKLQRSYFSCIFKQFELDGRLNLSALQEAYSMLFKKHNSLSTIFIKIIGEYRQGTQPLPTTKNMRYINIREAHSRTRLIKNLIKKEAESSFDLTNGPLVSTTLIQSEEFNFILLFKIHHIICDGWSLGLLLNDWIFFYNSIIRECKPKIVLPRIDFKDYSAWIIGNKESEKYRQQRQYWERKFERIVPSPIKLSTDFTRPAQKSWSLAFEYLKIKKQLVCHVREITKKHESSLFTTLLAFLKTILYCFTKQTDITIGTYVAGRDQKDLTNIVGNFAYTDLVRTVFDENQSFKYLLKKVKHAIEDMTKYTTCTLQNVVNNRISLKSLTEPLWNVNAHMSNSLPNQNLPNPKNLTIKPYNSGIPYNFSEIDIKFTFVETGQNIFLLAEYDTDIFRSATIKDILIKFNEAIDLIQSNETIPLNQIYNHLNAKVFSDI